MVWLGREGWFVSFGLEGKVCWFVCFVLFVFCFVFGWLGWFVGWLVCLRLEGKVCLLFVCFGWAGNVFLFVLFFGWMLVLCLLAFGFVLFCLVLVVLF